MSSVTPQQQQQQQQNKNTREQKQQKIIILKNITLYCLILKREKEGWIPQKAQKFLEDIDNDGGDGWTEAEK